MAKTPTWQRAAGKSESGGLNEAGRRSLRAAGHDIKRPQPEGGPRKKSFCSRMRGMKAKLTSAETANDPDSRINKSLRKWKCADGGDVTVDNALRMARGRPDEGRQEEFLREQLAGSSPQYEPSQDFPARAERAVQTADRYAGMLNDLAARGAMMPREFESPQGRGAREIVESALPQDPNAIVKQAMRQAGEGNRLAAAETMLGGIPETGAIRAYHGSPHRFDRFDLSKIGTGEGAQAYGHGLYFAENEDVARGYRGSPELKYERLSGHMSPVEEAVYDKIVSGADSHDVFTRLKNLGYSDNQLFDAIDKIYPQKGHMYEVEIAAEPHQLLDWDKPLSEQSPVVQRAISDDRIFDPTMNGTEFYHDKASAVRRLAEQNDVHPHQIVSEQLRKSGIPGIKYLDQVSRGAGEGSRNYVIFDPSIIDIKRRYADGGEVEDAIRMARNMGGGALYNQLNYALNSPTPANPPQDPGPQQPYYQSLPQTRDMIQQYGSPAPQAPSSSPVRQPMPYAKGGKAVWEKSRPKDLGKSKPLSPSQKASAKAAAKAAGRPYPNLIDNMRAARKADGGQVEGSVQFAPTDLPMMAQHPDVEIENALRAARSVEPAKKEYAPFSVLPLREDESGIHFDPNAGVIGGVKRAGKYFYDTMSGQREMDPTSQEAVEAASNIAGMATLGAGAMERPVGSLAAGVDKRFLENLAEQYRAHYDPSARILGQPRKEWLSSVKLSRPIEEMRVSSTEHRPMVAERFTEPEEYAGKAMITGLGDRTPAGYEITGINDRELTAPVNMMGGAAFGRDIASLGPDRAVWGSALSRAQAIGNKARAAAEKKYEPVFTYVAQGPASGDFSHHMQDLVLGQVRPEKMDPKLAETIDRRMRESQTGSGETFAPKPEWVGIRSPEMASRMKERADERVKLIKLMDSAAYRDAPGFADVGAARFASTDPSLLHDPSFSAGKAFMSIDPKGTVVRNPVNPHPSYDTFLSAAPGRHGYLGRLEYELPPELHFKHYLENEIKPELRDKPLDKQTMSLLRQHPTVIATPEWVDAASSWQNFMRSRYGSRRP